MKASLSVLGLARNFGDGNYQDSIPGTCFHGKNTETDWQDSWTSAQQSALVTAGEITQPRKPGEQFQPSCPVASIDANSRKEYHPAVSS